jgi:hypothetical protein
MTTKRRDLTLPVDWKPGRLARVRCLPLMPKGARPGHTGHAPPPWQPVGEWRVVDRAPDTRGPSSWWLAPVNDAARSWAARFGQDMVQGHVSVPGRLLVPAGVQLDLDDA